VSQNDGYIVGLKVAKRPVASGRLGSSPAPCDGSLTAGSVGIHTIYFCELLRVTVRVILGAMQGYVRRFDHRSVSVAFPRLSTARGLLRMVAAWIAPCSVKAKGRLRRPSQLDVAKRDFKFANSSVYRRGWTEAQRQ
jgi:hypothetical protein